jgi:hypothetical protein
MARANFPVGIEMIDESFFANYGFETQESTPINLKTSSFHHKWFQNNNRPINQVMLLQVQSWWCVWCKINHQPRSAEGFT